MTLPGVERAGDIEAEIREGEGVGAVLCVEVEGRFRLLAELPYEVHAI